MTTPEYPWLTVDGEHVEARIGDVTNAEADRRLIIMQEIRAGRLVLASAVRAAEGRIEQRHDNEQVRQMRRTGRCPVCGADA